MKKTEQNKGLKWGGLYLNERVGKRRKQLIEAGIEEFGAKGYVKARIKDICMLAGLTERYFYESFKNKEELLECVYREIVDEMTGNILTYLNQPALTPLEATTGSFRLFYHSLLENPKKARIIFFEILGVSPAIDRHYRIGLNHMASVISAAICKGYPEVDPETLNETILPAALAGSISHIAEIWILGNFKTPLDDITAQITRLVLSFDFDMFLGKK